VELNLDSFRRCLARNRLIPNQCLILLGVSGGPDSVALLHLFTRLRHDNEITPRPVVAHLNHKLRGAESDDDAEFVRTLCASLEVPCHIEAREVEFKKRRKNNDKNANTPLNPPLERGEADRLGENHEMAGIEDAARRARYEFFHRVCLLTGAKYVAVAHHADDQVETVLHRIIRGTGIRGLAGMPMRRPLRPGSDITLIRPLLPFNREQVLAYLSHNSFEYRHDTSNFSRGPTRNRIRHDLIPLLRDQFNQRTPNAILRLSAQARLVYEHLSDVAVRGYEPLVVARDAGAISLDASALRHKSPIVQAEIIRLACVELGLGERDFSFERLNSVTAMLGESSENWRINLPGNAFAELRGQQLILTRHRP